MSKSNKVKKTQSSLSFSLSRLFRKISTNAPTAFILTVIVLGYVIFLFGGGLFTLINWQTIQPSAYTGSAFLFIYPSTNAQFISDTIITVTLFTLGFVGLMSIYQSSKSAYNPRQAYMMLIIGVSFLLISYLMLELCIHIKIYGS
jgi:hypothetical protein